MEKKHFSKHILLITVLLVSIFLAGCGKKIVVPTYDDEIDPVDKTSVFCVVSNVDDVNSKITLRSVNYATEYVLEYTGASDVKDQYGENLSMSLVELGSIVDATYDANRDKLLSMKIAGSDKVSKYSQVSGAKIDYVENTISFNGEDYPLASNAAAYAENKEIGLDEICSEDELTIWVYNDTVCSLYVNLGHGYVKLVDYASYIGGTVEIGYDVIAPVTSDMLLTVREGTYTLRISKDGEVGTKDLTVMRNQELTLSLADLAIEPKQTGSVMFKVIPGDANVYIDGKKVNTEGSVELTYGKHKIYIEAEGYEKYSASFNVNYAYKMKEYNLKKLDSSETTSTAKNGATEPTTRAEKNTTTKQDKDKTTESTTGGAAEKDVNASTGKKTANKVTVTAPTGATVYFDGEYIGIAPISFTKVTGSHIITLSMSGYLSKSYTVSFTDDGSDQTLKYEALTSIASLIE